jgi:parvulin-like peptidyl-prolyl isomerase
MAQTVRSIGALSLVALVGTGYASAAAPAPELLPANVVAVVSHVPVDLGRITKAEFQRALVQSAAAAGREATPKPGAVGYERLKVEAIGERLNAVWIEGQAATMGIDVSARQVARELDRIKRENFESGAEYRRFLKESRLTRRDVDERVRLQLLATRIQERVMRRAPGNGAGAFNRFVEAFRKRWTARTVCAPRFVMGHCSNAPPSVRRPSA